MEREERARNMLACDYALVAAAHDADLLHCHRRQLRGSSDQSLEPLAFHMKHISHITRRLTRVLDERG